MGEETPLATGEATIGFNDLTASTSDGSYLWWQADPATVYTVDLALSPADSDYTIVAYIPLGIAFGEGATFNLNANIAFAATGPGDDVINFPEVPASSTDPFDLPDYTITVVAGPGDDLVSPVPDFSLSNASTISLVAYGGAGSDTVHGGRQNDLIHGDSYNTIDFSEDLPQDNALADETPDTFAGDDQLFGYRGSDTISGGPGNDVIDAGPRGYGDTDTATGGPGADNFLLSYNTDAATGGTDFWSIWGQNLTNDEVGQVVSSVVSEVLGEGASVAAGFALGGLGQILGATVESFIDFLIALDASETPTGGPDVLIVTDFDPSEDVIFVPVSEEVSLNNTVEYFESSTGPNGWGIQFSDDDDNTYAQVMLGDDFLTSLGIEQEDSTAAKSLLDSVLARSTVIGADGGMEQLTSDNVLQLLPGGGYTAPSATPIVPAGTRLAVWGAIGPVVADGSVAGFGDEGSITFGSAYSDALTSNPRLVNPETFTLSDSADAATLIEGYAGNDLIFGTTYSDTLSGGDDDDVIYTFLADIEDGELVPETVDGGRGDDTVYTGASGGTFTGGDGGDALIFFYGAQIDPSKSPQQAYQVVIDLTAQTPFIGDAVATGSTDVAPTTQPFTEALNSYTVTGFETFIGGPLNDWIRGSNGSVIGGGAGPDYLDVGAGAMGLTYQTSSEGVSVMLQPGRVVLSGGDATGDKLANLQTGSTYNVTNLTGTSSGDELYMVAADTTIYGGGGGDTFGMFFDPTNQVSLIQMPDFGQDDIIDMRQVGATSFDQLDFVAPFAFEYTDSGTGQMLRALLNFDLIEPLTAANFLFATAASGVAVGTRRDDAFAGAGEDDRFDGRQGDDALHGGDGDDMLLGRRGRDFLNGGNGDDTASGGAGGDRIDTGEGADRVHGGRGSDAALLGVGADLGFGGRGDDTFLGGADDDTLLGGRGDDLLAGQRGDDVLRGMAGGDRLLGGAGEDELYGGRGADSLNGGDDADRMAGGAGADLFRLGFSGLAGDSILDFDAVEGDRIVVVADRDVSVAQDAPGLFSVTDGASVHVFSAAGATLDDIAVLLA